MSHRFAPINTDQNIRDGKAATSFFAFAFLLIITASVMAQQPTVSPTPATADQSINVPSIAPNYRADKVPMPELARVGVDMDQQQPLSLREALKLALENNKDIEVARENVKIAEFDLLGARGAYDPRLSSQSYYERVKSPVSSFLSGGANGAVTQSDYTGTFRLEGLAPKGGGNYKLDFSSIRLNSIVDVSSSTLLNRRIFDCNSASWLMISQLAV